MSAFLGVETSLTGRRWVGPGVEAERLAAALTQRAGLEPPIAAVLARRGVPPEEATAFLAPALRDLLPDPMILKDMGPAAERLLAALRGRERIAIFADYDVDGGASAALLVGWLREMGLGATLYVPDRIDEGYGPNAPAMAALARDHDLIVCVDCGTLSHGPIAAATGADVIVLDHHLAAADLPDCVAVVNPNRQDETGDLGHLCAAAVVFLVLVELNRRLRQSGVTGPNLMAMLDLVALATVADVAPLTGVNRAFVRQGLVVMARRERPGLVALSDVARLDRPPTSYHLGFVLGPRVNAGGRIGQADLGARLLSTADPTEAAALAKRLDDLNSDRREIEARVREAALAQAADRGLDAPLVWAAEDGWHPGVVGIVASRLKDHTHRPAIVIGFEGDAGKGSGRSVSGVDLGASIQRLAAEGLIEKGGGHRMAAGLSLTRAQLEPAMDRLSALLDKQGARRGGAGDLRLDGVMMPVAASPELIEKIETAGPFGAAAPAPRFAFPAMRIRMTRPVGEGHLKLAFSDGGPGSLEAICFDAHRLGLDVLQSHTGRGVHLAGRVELNHWNGRARVQLRLEDAAWAD
ncbi:Single-stranded-DNA-specific exonuclease RecJ [Roseibacterium elongatum DSM 19469]|uniref:Single-stranded-DNA-specific exonuclease RecJ n=1 Tax=Roseicyclus elongatus DSM 19469 TaxID=1294273 RepID=W8STP6_9RHOB|nr:single-stranded-DNA-specific exonuclease RecJ [Roseibacterium elongatum]AHM05895.1 Single-stranded-DNA-specific exonuclease RecJ [Roseibacterium elongatum DSM 19469]